MPTTDKTMTPSLLLDRKIPIEHRKEVFADLCSTKSREASRIVEAVLKAASNSGGRDAYKQKKKELGELIESLRAGPQRLGVFMNLVGSPGAAPARAHVKLQDGSSTYPVVLDQEIAGTLKRGECVLLSARAEALLARDDLGIDTGEEARLEARLGDRVEISVHGNDQRHIMHVADVLKGRLDAGQVPIGSPLLICPRRSMAFDVVPCSSDGLSKFRFLSRETVPNVVVQRDVGDPPAFIETVARLCRAEMTVPQRRRRYRLRRSATLLLTGVSGSGKTLCVNATIRRVHEVMSEVTGLPLEQLPPRVLRLKMSRLLSMWLGQSDRNADQLADEITELAEQTVTGRDGKDFELPVLVILEELDGIARRRGLDHDGVYDRIQTSLLTRLDHTSNSTLRDRMVIVLATTNVPHLIDPAWIRRVGGQTFHFGRLQQRGFASVLDKQLGDLPLAHDNGHPPRRTKDLLISRVTTALFAPNGSDPALVEIQYAGMTVPDRKYRRDFLTASVLDRAVQQAADEACRAEEAGHGPCGITEGALLEAIERQVRAVAQALTPGNVGEFVNLPEAVRVSSVRRLDGAAMRSVDLTE